MPWFSSARPPLKRVFIPGLVSLVITYAAYAWIIQTPYFFSRSRLALGGLIWATLTVLLYILRLDCSRLLQQPWPRFLPGAGSLFILLNLVASAFFPKIPYTYLLLPEQSVIVRPLTLDGAIEIVSFTTENEGRQEIHRFLPTEQWKSLGLHITHVPGAEGALTWSGKPGQTVEIQFITCPTCGAVEVETNGEAERLDLTLGESDGVTRYEKRYAPLAFHKAANLVFFEAAALLTATLLFMATGHLLRAFSHKRIPQFPVIALPARWENTAVFGALAALTAINYGAKLQPILYNDDWCQIAYNANAGYLSLFMLDFRRPLHLFFAALYSSFLPVDQAVLALYLTQLGVLALTAYLIYRFVRECFDTSGGLALLCAALWLVFPNDYTNIYISMLPARMAFLLCVVFFLLVLRVIRNGSWPAAVGAVTAAVLGLLMYEGHLGMMAVGPVIFAILERDLLTRKKIAAITASYAGIAAFVVWRLLLQPLFYQDTKLANLDIHLRELSLQWLLTFKTLFGGFRLPAGGTGWLADESQWILILLLIGVILIGLLFLTLPAPQSKKSPLIQVAAGALLWTAGYFPILLNYPVNIYSHLSRVNLFANLGAVLLITGLLHVLATNLGGARTVPKLVLIFTLPLLLTASLVQLQVQESNRLSWAEAQTFYGALVKEIPDLKQDTQIVFQITTGESEPFTRRPLFTSSWEASCAVWTLYNTTEPNLLVGYKYTDLSLAPFPGYNILGGAMEKNSIGDVPDPNKLLVVNYNLKTADLEISQDIGFLGLGDTNSYKPEERILNGERYFASRKLIQPE